MCADKCTPFPPPTQAQAHKSESASRGEALAQHQGALAQAQGRLAELQHEVEERRVAADRMEGDRHQALARCAGRGGQGGYGCNLQDPNRFYSLYAVYSPVVWS